MQLAHLRAAGLAPEQGQRGAWPTSVSVTPRKSRKVAREGCWNVWQEPQAGLSRGGQRPLLSVFAVGVRCLCRAGLPDQPKRK